MSSRRRAVVGCLLLVIAASSSSPAPAYGDASAAFNCSEPLRNVTALVNTTLYTIVDYRSELQAAHRVAVEPINILPRLCADAIADFPQLERIELVLTGIAEVSPGAFMRLPRLAHLDLRYNRLEHIVGGVFSELPALANLRLTANRIRSIDAAAFSDLPRLAVLELAFNRLQLVDVAWFQRTPRLAKLDLRFNRLHALDEQLFNTLDVLQLDGNQLACVPEHLLETTSTRPLQELHLASNALECDCLTRLEQWSEQTNTTTFHADKDLKRCGLSSKLMETTTVLPEGILVDL